MSGYIKVGRGGAGNMFSKDELHKKEADLEAQESRVPHDGAAIEESSPAPQEEYKHMGRGGAGNWFVPAELAGGVIPDTSEAPTPEPLAEHPPSVRPWRGRGGAGNFAADTPQDTEAAEKAEAERAKVEEEQVRVSVDEQLQKPNQAHMRDGEKPFHQEMGWREAGL